MRQRGLGIFFSPSTQIHLQNSDALLRYSLESPVNRPKLKFCKQILGLKRNSSSLAVYGELCILPTALFAIIRTIKFWHIVSHLNDNILVKKAFTESKSIPSNISNWFVSVKWALEAIGLSTLWNNPSSLSPDQVNKVVKDKVFKIFQSFWKSELTSAHQGSLRHSKLRTYKTFTGRHKGLDVNDRICKNCSLGLIEDEVHFLLVCPAYSVPRSDHLSHTSVEPLTTNLQIQKIMSSNDNVTIAALASYLVQANQIREILAKEH